MADFDLYDDLELLHAQEKQKSAEDLAWKEKYEVALGTIERLQGEKKELNKKIKQLELNFASLFDTARTEIKRKDNLIAQLRKEKDDICFRRNVRPVKRDSFDGDGGHFNPFLSDTLDKGPKTVEKPVAEKSIPSSSRVKDGERPKTNHRDYPSNSGRGRDRSRGRSRDRCDGRWEERNYDRRRDRDKSQTGSSDGCRDKTDKSSRTHSHRIDHKKEKQPNGISNGYDSSKQNNNYSKYKPETNKESKIKSQKETKTENGRSVENLPQTNKENISKTQTLEADILKDVKEFKKQKLIEANEPKPVEDPLKVATEKSNQFLDALFDDLDMNDEESSSDVKKVPPAVVQKTEQKITTKTDENFNVELPRTPLKQTVSMLFDDLFGPSPGVSVNSDRRSSVISVGESSSSDSLQIKEKLTEKSNTKSSPIVGHDLNVKECKETEEKSSQDINDVTSKLAPLVADLQENKKEERTLHQVIPKTVPLAVDSAENRTKDDRQIEEKAVQQVADLNINTCTEVAKTRDKSTEQHNEVPSKTVLPGKTFKFVEFDSSFYSSDDEQDAAEKDTAIQSQSDIESPPFENCVQMDVIALEKDEQMDQASTDSKDDKGVPEENSKDKRTDNDCHNLTHAEKPKGSNQSDKKNDKLKRDSHHSNSFKDYKSSSTSSSSHKTEKRHHQSSRSKHDHRSRDKTETKRRHCADKRHNSRHNRKDSHGEKERLNRDSVGENKDGCTPRLTWSESTEDSTVKPAALQDENSSDLRLYQDQVISLTCDEISDEEDGEVKDREAGQQKANFVGLEEISDGECGEALIGGSKEEDGGVKEEFNRKEDAVCDEKEGEVNESLRNNMREVNEENRGDTDEDPGKSERESKRNVEENQNLKDEQEKPLELELHSNGKSSEFLETTASVDGERIEAEPTNCNVEPSTGDENISTINIAASSDIEKPFEDESDYKEEKDIDLEAVGDDTEQAKHKTQDTIDLGEENKLCSDSGDKTQPNNDKKDECHSLIDIQLTPDEKEDKLELASVLENDSKVCEQTEMHSGDLVTDMSCENSSGITVNPQIRDEADEETEKAIANIPKFVDEEDAHCENPEQGGMSLVEFFKSVKGEVVEEKNSPELGDTLDKSSTFAQAVQTSELQDISDGIDANVQLRETIEMSIDSIPLPAVRKSPNPSNSKILKAVMDMEEKPQPADGKEEAVCSGRRKKLKTPRKCTDEQKDPLTIIKMISGRYAKSDDGRSSAHQPNLKLRRTQSTSNLTSNDGERIIDKRIPINEKEASNVMEDEYHLEMPVLRFEEDSRDTTPAINAEANKYEVGSQTLSKERQFPITEEVIPTTVSKKRKREKISDKDKQSGRMHHKKRILQNSNAEKSITKDTIEDSLKNKRRKKVSHSVAEPIPTDKERDFIDPHSESIQSDHSTLAENVASVNHPAEAPSVPEPFVTSEDKKRQKQVVEMSSGIEIIDVSHSPNKASIMADALLTNDSKKATNEPSVINIDSTALCDRNLPMKSLTATNSNKKKRNKTVDNVNGTPIVDSSLVKDSEEPESMAHGNLQDASVDIEQDELKEESHPVVECTETSNNKKKYKKRILQNFIDDSGSANVAPSHTRHKTKKPSNSNDPDEPNNNKIHHKKRLLQQSSDNAVIKDSASSNKKKHIKKDEPATSSNKKKQGNHSPPEGIRDSDSIEMVGKKENPNSSSKSEVTDCEIVSTTSHSNRKYKKRILESFTDSNATVVLGNELIIKSSVAAEPPVVDAKRKHKKKSSPDPSSKHPAVVPEAIDTPPTHKKKRSKKCMNSEENLFAVESKEYQDPDVLNTKKSLVISVMKLPSPVKVSPIGSAGTCSLQSNNEATNSITSTHNVANPIESHSTDERERNAIYIKRKMKPSKQVSEKKNKQKLVPCDKPSFLDNQTPPSTKRKRSLSQDKSPPNTSAATPTHHKIFNEDVFSENQQAALPSPYNANGDDVQYQEIDNRMRSMFQSPTYPTQFQQQTNVECSFELANTTASSLPDDHLEGNLTIEETLIQNESSLCDTSTSSRKISFGSNDYVIETVGAHTANVFITRKKCKKRTKIAMATA